jgi:LysR family transcriptional regulator, hypochlorite-specific transcription factor HypT
MDAKWLEDFLSVARTGNFSQSASERNVTQSAFSRRIKSLEQWVGVALIDRSSYPTRLTPAGVEFHAAAQKASRSLLKTRQDLRQALSANRNVLRIAVQHSLASQFLVQWLATLPLAKDSWLVRVRADNLHDCVRDLEEGNVDLLVRYAHADLPLSLDDSRYPSLTIARETLTPYSKPGGDRQPLHSLRPQADAPVPWLTYSGEAFLGSATALAVARASPPLELYPVFESALTEALRAAALGGLGVVWLPARMVADDLQQHRLVRAGPAEFDEPLLICLHGDRSVLTDRFDRLWESIRRLASRPADPSA